MKRTRLSGILCVCLIIAVVLTLSGCETMAALGAGKLSNDDLTYLAYASTTFADISGVEDDRLPGELYPEGSLEWQRSETWKQLVSADSWLEKNLW